MIFKYNWNFVDQLIVLNGYAIGQVFLSCKFHGSTIKGTPFFQFCQLGAIKYWHTQLYSDHNQLSSLLHFPFKCNHEKISYVLLYFVVAQQRLNTGHVTLLKSGCVKFIITFPLQMQSWKDFLCITLFCCCTAEIEHSTYGVWFFLLFDL